MRSCLLQQTQAVVQLSDHLLPCCSNTSKRLVWVPLWEADYLLGKDDKVFRHAWQKPEIYTKLWTKTAHRGHNRRWKDTITTELNENKVWKCELYSHSIEQHPVADACQQGFYKIRVASWLPQNRSASQRLCCRGLLGEVLRWKRQSNWPSLVQIPVMAPLLWLRGFVAMAWLLWLHI
jgi:hypothetical protein